MYFPKYHPFMYQNGRSQRRKFTPEEDERLCKIVEKYGAQKWDSIAKEMPGRTGRQCRDRYKNYLIPGFFNGQWSTEEDLLLREKFKEYGSQWSKMMKFFNKRSANALKNRWNYFVSRQDLGKNEDIKTEMEPKTEESSESEARNKKSTCDEDCFEGNSMISEFSQNIGFFADLDKGFIEDLDFQFISGNSLNFMEKNNYDLKISNGLQFT